MEEKKTFTRIDDLTFKLEQDKHLEENIDSIAMLNNLAQAVNNMKACINQANQLQDKFLKYAEWYNLRVEILTEAKEKCQLDIEVPVKLDIPSCFDIIEAKIENLPTIKVKAREEATDESK